MAKRRLRLMRRLKIVSGVSSEATSRPRRSVSRVSARDSATAERTSCPDVRPGALHPAAGSAAGTWKNSGVPRASGSVENARSTVRVSV